VTVVRSPFELSRTEIACGLVLGREEAAHPTVKADRGGPDPLTALEGAVLPALLRPPCLVSFSGGRDSSAVLAVATAVARREGLPEPVPATNVFAPNLPASETRWQELVLRHLALEDWARVEIHDDLECVGPVAMTVLRRHGLLWPFNAHFHWPLLELARGGSLLTGVGGDELLGSSRWARADAVLSGSVRPVPKDLARVGLAASPRLVRALVLRRRLSASWPWLSAPALADCRGALAAEAAREPLRWSRRWHWWRGRRQTRIGLRSLALLAADHDVEISHPLTDEPFAVAVGRFASGRRIFDRTALVRALFGDLVPEEALMRQSKASFDEVFWGNRCRRSVAPAINLLRDWDELDVEGLAAVWADPIPDSHTYLLLQAALLLGVEKPPPAGPAVRTVVSDTPKP
jgi:asparagine synthase (glutamine-hydrolysing)